MNKLKLKSGREVELKELGLEDEAAIMDTVHYRFDKDGNLITEMQNTAMLKYLRLSLNGEGDDYIRNLSYSEKMEIYTHFVNSQVGEGKASNSK